MRDRYLFLGGPVADTWRMLDHPFPVARVIDWGNAEGCPLGNGAPIAATVNVTYYRRAVIAHSYRPDEWVYVPNDSTEDELRAAVTAEISRRIASSR